MASRPIYQFYAELCDYTPKMWRRFQIANDISIARLGYVLMTLFEMKANHSFYFTVPFKENFFRFMGSEGAKGQEEKLSALAIRMETMGAIRRYEIMDEESLFFAEEGKIYEATTHKMKHMLPYPGDEASFFYDYGDGWKVHLVVEGIAIDEKSHGKEFPRVLEGEGFGIIEDCGGPDRLHEIAEAFKTKQGELYREVREWLGISDLRLEVFDVDDMNFRIKKVPRIYTDIYEYLLTPTQPSMDLLERKYLEEE